MVISILTLFPEMFASAFGYSIVKRAQDQKQVNINLINIRDFAEDKYKSVDDRPYGGGVGMIMRVDIIDKAIQAAKTKYPDLQTKIVLLDTRGVIWKQQMARNLSKIKHLILICGHYEEVDARVMQLVDEIISIGNFVLTGGEIPAMVVVDSVVRLIHGVLKPEATLEESFTGSNLSFPQYTRPEIYKNMAVPKVLLSGNTKLIKEWKEKNSKKLPHLRHPANPFNDK